MGRKKKSFINKKTAHHFAVMHRSQQDPKYYQEGYSNVVLHPANPATAKALERMGLGDQLEGNAFMQQVAEDYKASMPPKSVQELREIDEFGLPLDGYDYNKHLAPIDGTGKFVNNAGEVVDSSLKVTPKEEEDETDALEQPKADKKKTFQLPDELFESSKVHDRMLEAITLKPDRMDNELRVLLEEGDERIPQNFKEDMDECINTLDDDFMTQLLQAEEDGCPDGEVFDYDAHVARLMAEADAEDGEYDSDEIDEEELFQRTSDERQVRDIDVHFEKLLLDEYGDEEIGELDHVDFDDRVGGTVASNADHVNTLVQDFIKEKQADKDRVKEIGATPGNTELKAKQLEAEGFEDEELNDDEMLKRWGYENKPKPKWDCETIVSTYSVLDNHPKLITVEKTKSKKNRNRNQPREETEGTESDPEDDLIPPLTKLVLQRDHTETPEEKRARKKMVKQQQRMRRQEKKSTKLMFKQEKTRQQHISRKLVEAAAPPKGVSTFKF